MNENKDSEKILKIPYAFWMKYDLKNMLCRTLESFCKIQHKSLEKCYKSYILSITTKKFNLIKKYDDVTWKKMTT